ncbi:MAG: hypothetical protein PHH77_12055 [Victivallaceae bacterium]|nr:hypothetical protein [Victivallaceae bacterium]
MKAQCPIGAMSLQEAAKELAARGIATGGQKIFGQLRGLGMLQGLHPSFHARYMGWMTERSGEWDKGRAYSRVFLTASGLDEAEFELRNAGEVEPVIEPHEYSLGVSGDCILGF